MSCWSARAARGFRGGLHGPVPHPIPAAPRQCWACAAPGGGASGVADPDGGHGLPRVLAVAVPLLRPFAKQALPETLRGAHRPSTHPQGRLSCLASTQDGNKRGSVCCRPRAHTRPPSCPLCAMSIPVPPRPSGCSSNVTSFGSQPSTLSLFPSLTPSSWVHWRGNRCGHGAGISAGEKTHDTVVGFLPCGVRSLSPHSPSVRLLQGWTEGRRSQHTLVTEGPDSAGSS